MLKKPQAILNCQGIELVHGMPFRGANFVIFAGGEFYADERFSTERRAPFPAQREWSYFFNGGQACLRVIGDYFVSQDIDKILLPAYLCPTIPATLEQSGMHCDYYQVNEDFSIDIDDLARLVATEAKAAVYFINYFGFTQPNAVIEHLRELRGNGRLLVEDNAQACYTHSPIGDFVFNSLRKFAPFDGAYLNAPFSLQPYIDRYRDRINRRLPVIRQYRLSLTRYLFQSTGEAEDLERLFYEAEAFYLSDQVVLGNAAERAAIERLDWPAIHRIRRENYRYLLKQVQDIPGVVPVFADLQADNMPLGLPIYLPGLPRDRVNAILGNSQIGLTIHWENMHQNPITPAQKLASGMSERILTLPIDQYTSHSQLDFLAEQLGHAVEIVKQG